MLKFSKESSFEVFQKFALEIVEGLKKEVTPFHAVDYCSKKLIKDGFKELNEK
jgi:hypothetical protein